jgi:hypothetical protein
MPNETDWGKHAAIAAWAGVVVAIVLVVVQEVWPPDPTHPMSLEVVSKPVVLSRWLAISILVGVTVAAIIITRRLIATRSDVAQHMDPQTRSQPTYPATQSQPTPVSRPISSKVSDDGKGFIASSADDFHVSILTHEDGGTKGLMAHILNERLTLIGNCSLTIFTAQRRISLMDEYEENLTFEPFSLNESAPIGPSCSSKGIWIVRKEVSPRIYLSDPTATTLLPGQQKIFAWIMTGFLLFPCRPLHTSGPLKTQ